MVDSKTQSVTSYLDGMVAQGKLTLNASGSKDPRMYTAPNEKNSEFLGEVALASNDEIAYCSVNGLTNKKYMRGEALSLKDVQDFLNSVEKDDVSESRSLFGKKIIRLRNSGLTFKIKL